MIKKNIRIGKKLCSVLDREIETYWKIPTDMKMSNS